MNPTPDCPICNDLSRVRHRRAIDIWFHHDGCWDYFSCLRCDHVWRIIDDDEDLSQYYDNYYTHERSLKGSSLNEGSKREYLEFLVTGKIPKQFTHAALLLWMILRPSARVHVENGIRELKLAGVKPGSKLLDFGCGDARFFAKWERYGLTVVGYDFDAAVLDRACSQGKSVVYDLDDERLQGSFDTIYMNHAVEHLVDPAFELRRMAGLLVPGGRLICVTPNSRSINHQLFKQTWRGLEPPRHVHIFSEAGLGRLLADCGFRCVEKYRGKRGCGWVFLESWLGRRSFISGRFKRATFLLLSPVLYLLFFFACILGRQEEIVMSAER